VFDPPSRFLCSFSIYLSEICHAFRGTQVSLGGTRDGQRSTVVYRIPFSELITDFFDEVKSASSGYATLDYEMGGYERGTWAGRCFSVFYAERCLKEKV
jgi:translation elongation factor EF-4